MFFLVFRCNLAAVLLGFIIFKPLAFALDPLMDQLGMSLIGAFPDLIHKASYAPIIAWSKLNNSVVLGSMASGWLLAVPAFLLIVLAVARYRRVMNEGRRARARKHLQKYWLFRIVYYIFVGPLNVGG